MKNLFILLLTLFSTSSLFAIGPRKILPPLNRTLFKTSLSNTLLRKSFTQLHASRQLAQLSQAERALLLAHTFIAENNRWPRTVISVGGKLVPTENYTPEQKQEIALGRLLRFTLEDNSRTDPHIRKELEQLKSRYSTARTAPFMLDQLNEWLSLHSSWPREKISKTGPLTPQEEAEIELAQYVNKFADGRLTTAPKDLVDQIRLIRIAYDPTYRRLDSQGKLDEIEEMETNSVPSFNVNPYPSMMEFPVSENMYQPLAQVTRLSEKVSMPIVSGSKDTYLPAQYRVLGWPSEVEEDLHVSVSEAKKIRAKLITWLQTYHSWPKIITDKSLSKYTQMEMEGEILAKDLLRLQAANFTVEDIRTAWRDGVLDENFQISDDDVPQQEEPRSLQTLKLNLATKPNLEKLAQQDSAIALLQDLRLWLQEYRAWPSADVSACNLTGWQRVLERNLAWRIEAFVMFKKPSRKDKNRLMLAQDWKEALASPSAYFDPELEQLRFLYQQWN